MEHPHKYRLGKREQESENRFIRLAQEYDLNYWCGRLECNRDELREAVNTVGSRAGEVAKYLDRRGIPEVRYRKGGFVDFLREV